MFMFLLDDAGLIWLRLGRLAADGLGYVRLS